MWHARARTTLSSHSLRYSSSFSASMMGMGRMGPSSSRAALFLRSAPPITTSSHCPASGGALRWYSTPQKDDGEQPNDLNQPSSTDDPVQPSSGDTTTAESGSVGGDEPTPSGESSTTDSAVDPVAALEEEVKSLSDKLKRCQAERENTIRIAKRDVSAATDKGVANFAKEFLGVADNLRRAIDSVPADLRDSEGVKPLLEGVEMTEQILQSTFTKFDIRLIDPLGEPFDPNVHNALFEMPNPDMEDGVVGMVQQTGYVLKERILRAAAVGVVRNPTPPPPGSGAENQ